MDGRENLSALHVSFAFLCFLFFNFSTGKLVSISKKQSQILEHGTRQLPLFKNKQQKCGIVNMGSTGEPDDLEKLSRSIVFITWQVILTKTNDVKKT